MPEITAITLKHGYHSPLHNMVKV